MQQSNLGFQMFAPLQIYFDPTDWGKVKKATERLARVRNRLRTADFYHSIMSIVKIFRTARPASARNDGHERHMNRQSTPDQLATSACC
jgi:hypothetical protein